MEVPEAVEEPQSEDEPSVLFVTSDERTALLDPTAEDSTECHEIGDSNGSGLTYVTFLLCGLCTVFPWNVFITAKPYFDSKLESNSTANGTATSYENMLEPFFGIGSQVTGLIMQLIVTSTIHRVSLDIRIHIPLLVMFLIFLVTGALAWVPCDTWVEWFFYLTIATVILVSVFAAVFTISTFGLAGVFPKRFMHATMIGQGVGGVVVSAFEVLVLLIMGHNQILTGFIYFMCAVLVILATIFLYSSMTRDQYAIPYLEDAKLEDSLSASVQQDRTRPRPPFLKILAKIIVPAMSVFMVFLVTLGSFPSVIALIETNSKNEKWQEFFTPVVCFLLFNVWDFIGRTSSFLQIPSEKYQWVLLVLATLRLAFYPLFAFCNITAENRSNTAPFFVDDVYPIIFVTLLGLSNGYLSSLCVMYAPKLVDPEHQETAGAMISFCVTLGLAVGSLTSLAVITAI